MLLFLVGDPQPHSVPVGFQVARDPVTGHILLLPATNVGQLFFMLLEYMCKHVIDFKTCDFVIMSNQELFLLNLEA